MKGRGEKTGWWEKFEVMETVKNTCNNKLSFANLMMRGNGTEKVIENIDGKSNGTGNNSKGRVL